MEVSGGREGSAGVGRDSARVCVCRGAGVGSQGVGGGGGGGRPQPPKPPPPPPRRLQPLSARRVAEHVCPGSRGEHRREQRVVAADAERFGLANETRVNWRVN